MNNSSILITGATGLVGNSLLKIVSNDPYFTEVKVLTRRIIPAQNNLTQYQTDFNEPSSYSSQVKADTVVCAIGTTIKKAGSQEKFRYVDYQIPLQIAEAASANKCDKFILVSAVGADPYSKVFYNRIKGELERDLIKLKFRSIHILRPSLLLGKREEKRAGEAIGQIMMPLFHFLLPPKYRAIKAETVAAKISEISKSDSEGIFFYEGKDLLN
jgi:uncharacterized protein YbjT (DUF2867 family)